MPNLSLGDKVMPFLFCHVMTLVEFIHFFLIYMTDSFGDLF